MIRKKDCNLRYIHGWILKIESIHRLYHVNCKINTRFVIDVLKVSLNRDLFIDGCS